ncbi:hypothetical protein QJS04_geneDACA004771 [Acorus gramineus]|uniref:Uncharacterized protein n=1 Tax=Acorus gramineus TaxID=55184 RepID=A0AAV9BU26_ACOGR|nr:hypothetical protein QJS04_geneDACA004771 [Acorus gramineus]
MATDDIEEEGQSRRYSPRGLEKSKTYAGPESSVGLEKSKKGDDWWIRSNWAFLNEPPRDELDESAQKYAAQFHVAELATNKHHERTGSN